ncbi:hypothetical protein O181_095482 [Austropuccinia psidii MF-1]|uniref:Uncharacterized protein n=1 Tax=Austropuccinia psidii MF-1 TaxID=1389203 RepID=A0A9Q3J5G0_9BASI|nr:hypothetical protein [Austropuccinia psidii MF-1]
MAMNHHRTLFGRGSPLTTFQPMAPGTHQRPPDLLSSILPLNLRGILPFLHAPHTEAAGVVHIWYYIPLCTIFSQKFNGDIFRTQFHLSKSRSQNTTPILKEDSLTHQCGNPWRQSEDHSRIPITWHCRSWVGNSFRIIPRAISEATHYFNQLARHQVSQYSLDNSIGPYRGQSINLYVLGAIGPIHIPLCEFRHTVQISRWLDLY